MKSQIFVIDDHALVRLGMRQLLNGEPDLNVCGEAEDLRGALDKLERITKNVERWLPPPEDRGLPHGDRDRCLRTAK